MGNEWKEENLGSKSKRGKSKGWVSFRMRQSSHLCLDLKQTHLPTKNQAVASHFWVSCAPNSRQSWPRLCMPDCCTPASPAILVILGASIGQTVRTSWSTRWGRKCAGVNGGHTGTRCCPWVTTSHIIGHADQLASICFLLYYTLPIFLSMRLLAASPCAEVEDWVDIYADLEITPSHWQVGQRGNSS